MRYVALLRGINVGGNNIIRMEALRETFAGLGFTEVATYIQSGNVVFSAPQTAAAKLTTTIERALGKAFAYEAAVVVLSARALARVIAEAPPGYGDDGARFRHDVIFVKPPLTARAALPSVPAKPGVDEVDAGAHAIYVRRLIAKASQSRIGKIVASPIYKQITIRNWSTTCKLHTMASPRST